MPHGRQIETGPNPTHVVSFMSYALVDGADGPTPGAWVDLRGIRHWTVDVQGPFVATIQLQASNAPSKPANDEDGNQLGPLITRPMLVGIQCPVRWVKAKVLDARAGHVFVYLNGVSQ